MNKAQKKIVIRWLLMSFIIIFFIIFSDIIQSNWDTIKWPAIIVIIALALFDKNRRTHAQGRYEFNRIIEEYPWVKTYLIIYFFIIAILVNYVLYNEIKLNVEAGGLLLILTSFFLPLIIIREREEYRNASKEI